MGVAAREKGLDLQGGLAGECDIKGDRDRLRQLFFNLLDNAIKYTPPGGRVSIEFSVEHGHARVVVADTGIGIPADHLPHVFERFYRVDSSRSSDANGNGLGLAICCSIAESHAGRLAIESTPGIGTRVAVILPIDAEDFAIRNPRERLANSGNGDPAIARNRDASSPGAVGEPRTRITGSRQAV